MHKFLACTLNEIHKADRGAAADPMACANGEICSAIRDDDLDLTVTNGDSLTGSESSSSTDGVGMVGRSILGGLNFGDESE